MKEQILKLRAEGKTYNEIKSILGCSKGTISFHCGKGQKEKSKNRLDKFRHNNTRDYLFRRLLHFQKRDDLNRNYDKSKLITFTLDDFIEKFGYDTKCGLTGLPINLINDRNWEIDHIKPKSLGGDNSLNNCRILLKDVNQMKHGLSDNELIEYCKKIIKYAG